MVAFVLLGAAAGVVVAGSATSWDGLLLAIVGMLACAALASLIPARRAVRVDASVALRDEG